MLSRMMNLTKTMRLWHKVMTKACNFRRVSPTLTVPHSAKSTWAVWPGSKLSVRYGVRRRGRTNAT